MLVSNGQKLVLSIGIPHLIWQTFRLQVLCFTAITFRLFRGTGHLAEGGDVLRLI